MNKQEVIESLKTARRRDGGAFTITKIVCSVYGQLERIYGTIDGTKSVIWNSSGRPKLIDGIVPINKYEGYDLVIIKTVEESGLTYLNIAKLRNGKRHNIKHIEVDPSGFQIIVGTVDDDNKKTTWADWGHNYGVIEEWRTKPLRDEGYDLVIVEQLNINE